MTPKPLLRDNMEEWKSQSSANLRDLSYTQSHLLPIRDPSFPCCTPTLKWLSMARHMTLFHLNVDCAVREESTVWLDRTAQSRLQIGKHNNPLKHGGYFVCHLLPHSEYLQFHDIVVSVCFVIVPKLITSAAFNSITCLDFVRGMERFL